MASTFTTNLRIEKQATGENNATWGTKENNTYDLLERAIAGLVTVPIANVNITLSNNNGVEDQSRYMMLNFTGALTAARTVTIPSVSKIYLVANATTGGFAVNITTGAPGVSYALSAGQRKLIYTDGASIFSNDDLVAMSSATKRWGIPAYINEATHPADPGVMEIGKLIDFHNTNADANNFSVRFGPVDATGAVSTTDLFITPASGAARKVWNEGNGGALSGLDADKLDGLHASQIGIASGTTMLFAQSAAPVGWTRVSDSTYNNRALRVITTGGPVSTGGTTDFTSVFTSSRTPAGTVGGTVLTEANLPVHGHPFTGAQVMTSGEANTAGVPQDHTHGAGTYSATQGATAALGGNHTHTITGQVPTQTVGFGFASGSGVTTDTTGTANAGGAHSHDVAGTSSGRSAGHVHFVTAAGDIGAIGSNVAHTHPFTGAAMDFAVKYMDIILATKA